MSEQPESMFVGKHYEMNPQFEDLLFDGTLLKNGMIVLLAEAFRRTDMNLIHNSGTEYLARETNRWCVVTNLNTSSGYNVEFVAVYGDGTKRKRIYGTVAAWLVKVDSIPINGESEENNSYCPERICYCPHKKGNNKS